MPFCFGRITLTDVTVLYVRTRIETPEGRSAWGIGSSIASPLWFDKDPERSAADKMRNLMLSVRLAADAYTVAAPQAARPLHRSASDAAAARARALGINPLTASFGVAVLDAAVIDALCRLTGCTFHTGLREDLFGLGRDFARFVPKQPLSHLHVRHTVGLADPLRRSDVAAPLNDGLPETLEEVIESYGVSWFKIKITSDLEQTHERLARIGELLEEHALDYRITLDGNEHFVTGDVLERFVRETAASTQLRSLWRRTLFIEQPLERDAALAEGVAAPLARVAEAKPVVIDESDGTDDTLERALALGYAGVSAKNGKGVFRTLHNHGVIQERNSRGATTAFVTAEDLTNVPVFALHQDTCLVAALGLPHVERNGHHYVRGLEFLAAGERETALAEFPSLYRRGPDGLSRLHIENGRIDVSEINRHGYGTCTPPDPEALEAFELPEPGPSAEDEE